MITIKVKNDKEKIEAFTLCFTYKRLDKEIKIFTVENNKNFSGYFDEAIQMFYTEDNNSNFTKNEAIKQAKRHDPNILLIDEY